MPPRMMVLESSGRIKVLLDKNLDPVIGFPLFYALMEVEGSTGWYLILGIEKLLWVNLPANQR